MKTKTIKPSVSLLTLLIVPAMFISGCNTGTSNTATPANSDQALSYALADNGDLYLNKGKDWVKATSANDNNSQGFPTSLALSCNGDDCVTVAAKGGLSSSEDLNTWQGVATDVDTDTKDDGLQMSKNLYDIISLRERAGRTNQVDASTEEDKFVAVGASGSVYVVAKENDAKTTTGQRLRMKAVTINDGLNDDLYGLARNSAQQTLAVGQHGSIVKVEKDANKWVAIRKHRKLDEGNLHAVYCTQSADQVCIAAGQDGMILRSTNDGDTWTRVETTAKNTFWAISANDSSTGKVIVAAGENQIFYSKDEGITWEAGKVSDGLTNFSVYSLIYLPEEKVVVGNLILENGLISPNSLLVSKDFGVTWQVVKGNNSTATGSQTQFDSGVKFSKMDHICKAMTPECGYDNKFIQDVIYDPKATKVSYDF